MTTSLRAAWLDGQFGGVLLNLRCALDGGGGDLLLGGGEDLLLLLFDGGLDALLVGCSVFLGLGAHGGDLLVELAEACFHAVQAGAGLFGRGAGIDEVLLDGGVAVAEGLGQGLEQEPADQQTRTTKLLTVKAVAACSGFMPSFAPRARTVGEWRYASFSSFSCSFFSGDWASGVLDAHRIGSDGSRAPAHERCDGSGSE